MDNLEFDSGFKSRLMKFLDSENALDEREIPWTNASSIGQVSFCPQALYLNRNGVQISDVAQQRIERGNAAHASVSSPGADTRCYIATYAFGANHPIVYELRVWRDLTLRKTRAGRLFIKVYYRCSPELIQFFGKHPMFNRMAKLLITKFANRLRK